MPHKLTLTSNIFSDPLTVQGAVSVQVIQVVCHPPAGLSSSAHTSSGTSCFAHPQNIGTKPGGTQGVSVPSMMANPHVGGPVTKSLQKSIFQSLSTISRCF